MGAPHRRQVQEPKSCWPACRDRATARDTHGDRLNWGAAAAIFLGLEFLARVAEGQEA